MHASFEVKKTAMIHSSRSKLMQSHAVFRVSHIGDSDESVEKLPRIHIWINAVISRTVASPYVRGRFMPRDVTFNPLTTRG